MDHSDWPRGAFALSASRRVYSINPQPTTGSTDATLSMLVRVWETHQRLSAGIPDGNTVDLSLIRLPASGLMFPNLPAEGASFTTPRIPQSVSQAFARRAESLSFGRVRFHDLRGIHSTALLDPAFLYTRSRSGSATTPATLLRNYTKRKRSKTADEKLAEAISGLAAGFLVP